jgi:hypothetical protein
LFIGFGGGGNDRIPRDRVGELGVLLLVVIENENGIAYYPPNYMEIPERNGKM